MQCNKGKKKLKGAYKYRSKDSQIFLTHTVSQRKKCRTESELTFHQVEKGIWGTEKTASAKV